MENNTENLNALQKDLNSLAGNLAGLMNKVQSSLSQEQQTELSNALKTVNMDEVMKQVSGANDLINNLRSKL